MAGVKWTAVPTAAFATGTSRKTILQVLAASNHRALVKEWGISFAGVTNTAVPILVELVVQSTAGSSGDSLTVQKRNTSDDETLQITALSNIDGSTAPTDTRVVWVGYVHPQGGRDWQAPWGEEWPVKGGERLGVVVTAVEDVNVVPYMHGEE